MVVLDTVVLKKKNWILYLTLDHWMTDGGLRENFDGMWLIMG